MKRKLETEHQGKKPRLLPPYKAVILDIEGTTTSISFVADVLFPWIRKNVHTYLEKNYDKPEIHEIMKKLKEQCEKDLLNDYTAAPHVNLHDKSSSIETVTKYVLWNMDIDRKMTTLKELQGNMFGEGYQSGELKGHVYADVKPILDKWKDMGVKIYIYSSGSVLAQKLLFGWSIQGSKLDSSSYVKIAGEVFKETQNLNILFLTDNVKEAEAADPVGIHTVVVCRDGIFKQDLPFTQIKSFDELFE